APREVRLEGQFAHVHPSRQACLQITVLFPDDWRMEKVASLKSDQLAPFVPFVPSALSAVSQNLAGLPDPEAQTKGFRVMRRIPAHLYGRRKMPRCLKGCAHSYWRPFE